MTTTLNQYTVGALVEIPMSFKHPVTGAALDPTTVKLSYRDPEGGETTLVHPHANLVKNAVGDYSGFIAATKAGTWRYLGHSEGPVGQATAAGAFEVEATFL